MSNNYKKSMDKIILSDELKNKIVQDMISRKTETRAAEKYRSEMNRLRLSDIVKQKIIKTALLHKNKTRKKRFHININSLASITACLLLFVTAASAMHIVSEYPGRYVPYNDTTPDIQDSGSTAQTQNNGDNIKETQESGKDTKTESSAETSEDGSQQALPYQGKNININDPQKNPESENITDDIPPAPSLPLNSESTPVLPPLSVVSPVSGDNEMYTAYHEFNTLDDLKNAVSYKLAEPQYIPSGYRLSGCTLITQELSELQYTNGNNRIIYRTQPGSDDCSGNYNAYSSVREITLYGETAVLKTDPQQGFLAVWNYGNMTYSLDGSKLLTENEIIKIIKNIM